MPSCYKQQLYFNQIVLKKAKITVFFHKKSKNNHIILVFSFMYLVSVYPINWTLIKIFANNASNDLQTENIPITTREPS